MLDTNWLKLCEAAILETNPDKPAICIGAAERAIAQRESLVDTTELERHKLADARSMLKTLSRIFCRNRATIARLKPRLPARSSDRKRDVQLGTLPSF